MGQIIQAFVSIATLRMGPEDLPASRFLLGLTLAAYLLTGGLSVSMYADSMADGVVQLVVDLAVLFGFFSLLLTLYRRQGRLLQTVIAVLGTGAFLSMLALPLSAWLRWEEAAGGAAAGYPAIGIYLIVLWSISVTGHIVHRALEIPYAGGLVLGVTYFVANLATFAYLFPAEA